ncbi:alpha/beta fold hydrolase [Streptacidiphilus monticola]|uniref:Alpha/beta fold hydrolase n=1 Tax=Streptacidiphilus monticola TaxID=2161674 RepID=A0ABW1G8Z6_9ACTN
MYVSAPNRFVTAGNGVRYAYRRCGALGGPPLVLLQNFRGTLDSWDQALVDALAAQRDVVAFDNAGVGLSAGRAARTVVATAQDTLAFLDALGLDRVDLLGFSLGGYVAQELALRHPARVRRMVLAATAPRGAAGIHGWSADVLAHVNPERLLAQDYLYTFFHHTPSSQQSGLEFFGRYIEREQDRDAPVSREAMEAQYEAVVEWGVPDPAALQRLADVRQPTLVTAGDSDRVVPPALAHLLGALIPGAQVHVYPDAGHGFLFQHHERFAADVLDFLSSSVHDAQGAENQVT